jgi:small subunit ribosomal protein S6
MRHYEIMIILDPNLEEKTVQPSLDQFLKVVTDGGGPIEKKPEGYYAIVDLTAEPNVVLELDRQLNLNEGILRTKVTRPDQH